MQLPVQKFYDMVVVGGGIHGVAVARDASMRGLSVLLVEQDDLGSGSSGLWSGLFSVGKKAYDYSTGRSVEESNELNDIQSIAPNLFYELPILIPHLRKSEPEVISRSKEWLTGYQSKLSASLGFKQAKYVHRQSCFELEPSFHPDIAGAMQVSDYAVDPLRLLIQTAKSASHYGAHIVTRHRLTQIETEAGKVTSCLVQKDAQVYQVKTGVIVNTTGAWSPLFPLPQGVSPIKQRATKGVHLVFKKRLVRGLCILDSIEGRRDVFVLPRGEFTVVGVTEDDLYEPLDDVQATAYEVGRLLEATQRYFPQVSATDISSVFVGYRSYFFEWGKPVHQLKTQAVISDHQSGGLEGVFSVVGGTFLFHRTTADRVTRKVLSYLKKKIDTSRTSLEVLPGCTDDLPWEQESINWELPPKLVRNLMFRHGYNSMRILNQMKSDPALGEILCEPNLITAAEINYFVEQEWSDSVRGVFRRARLGPGMWYPENSVEKVAQWMSRKLGWSEQETQFQIERARPEVFQGRAL